MIELGILTLLCIKHFVVDFPLQGPYQYLNKGYYGHWGGIEHAFLHFLGTFLVFIFFTLPHIAIAMALIDGIIHYHIDWAKVKINTKFNLKCNTSDTFWTLVGLDQLLHMLTYIGLVTIISGIL